MKERLIRYCLLYKGENECPFPVVSPEDDDWERSKWLREKEIVEWIIKALDSVSASLNWGLFDELEKKEGKEFKIRDIMYHVSVGIPLTLSIRKKKPFGSTLSESEEFYFYDDDEWEQYRKEYADNLPFRALIKSDSV